MDKLERRLARLWRRIGGGRRRERRSKKDESPTSLGRDGNVPSDKKEKARSSTPPSRHRHQSDSAASKESARSRDLSRALVRLYAFARLRSLQSMIVAESTPTLNGSTTPDLSSLEFQRPMEKFSFLSSLPQLSIPRLKSHEFDKLCLSRESGYLTNSPWDISSSSETIRQQRSPSFGCPQRPARKARSTPRRRFYASQGDVWASPEHCTSYVGLFEPMESYLSRNVYKSKCVTCVFEAAHAGLGVLLDDILAEFDRWFVGRKMLVVASELHFSVPLARRCRKQELILKQQMLRSLLENNRRILHLQRATDPLPVRLAEARTEENIFNNNELQTVQGVYQRCYHRLLPFVHSETPDWHAPYWKLSPSPVQPRMSALLLDSDPAKLRTHSLVSFNIIGLSFYGVRHQSHGVLLVVTAWNVFDPSKNASRLLRVVVEDVDDIAPEFLKSGMMLFTAPHSTANSDVVVGKVSVANDRGPAPHYYLMPTCAEEIGHFSIDGRSGEISVSALAQSGHKAREEFCVFASSRDGVDVGDLAYDAKNASMIRAAVEFDAEQAPSAPLPGPENNTVTVIQENMRSAIIPVTSSDGTDRGIRYSLENVQFTPVQNSSAAVLTGGPSLFFVNPRTGETRANPALADQPQGIYTILINAAATNPIEPPRRLIKKFHYVKDEMKLRYVLSMAPEEFATERKQFSRRLQQALKVDHPEGNMEVFLAEPRRDNRNATRTTVCFHAVMNEQVQSEKSAILALSQPTVENSELSRLYHHFQVVNIERCEETLMALRQSAFQLPMQVLLLVAGVALLLLLLIALITYICFVQRYKEHLRMKQSQLKLSEGTPSPLSYSPTFILPPVGPRYGYY